jgi:hypothetical protein
MDETRLQALLEQTTVNCYGEEEEFSGVLCTLDDNLSFPLQAEALGEQVEVIGLDDRRSSLRKGIVARVRKGGREYAVGLADLNFIAPDPTSAEWLAIYRYWAGTNEEEWRRSLSSPSHAVHRSLASTPSPAGLSLPCDSCTPYHGHVYWRQRSYT